MSTYTPEQEAQIDALTEEVQTLHGAVIAIKSKRARLREDALLHANNPYYSRAIAADIAALDADFTPANNALLDATKRLNEALNCPAYQPAKPF